MKVPKRLDELIRKKQLFIDDSRIRLESSVNKLQSQFLNDLLEDILPDLSVKEGSLLDALMNYRKLSQVETIFKKWNKIHQLSVVPEIINTTYGLVELESAYFAVALVDNLGERFDKVIQASKKLTDLRIGLDNGKMVRGGFLESFFKDQTLAIQTKSFISKAITGQIDTKDFIKGLRDIIEGVPRKAIIRGKEVLTQTGALEKQYQRYAYDIYQQYDRSYADSMAREFNMKYFLYQGGLIDDSRDFCVCHNNKVWSRDEAATWIDWVPADGDYPAGYEIKQKDLNKHPGYMDYVGYSPLVDAGGFNCRHSIGYIADLLAYELRPNLKPKK